MQVIFTLEQKVLTASGGNPLRRKAVKVNSLGSSQSLKIDSHSYNTKPTENISK